MSNSIWLNQNFQNFFLRVLAIILLVIVLIIDILTVKWDSTLLQIVIFVLVAIAGYDVYKLMQKPEEEGGKNG
jgi:uncharacterized membrane protein YdbT with pleckstrin-like domain